MSLPYSNSFRGLTIVGLPAERCYATKGDLVRVYFQLSEPPPLGWSYIFISVWRSLTYPMKRQTGVDGDAIWIDCVPEEVETCHWAQLDYATTKTNEIYQQKAQEQARDEERQNQLHAQLHFKLENLSQALYPRPAPQAKDDSLIARLFRYLWGGRKEKHLLPVARRAVVAPVVNMRDYHHGHFDGAAVGADGHSLQLAYYDHDQGGTRYCFRYVLSTHSAPRLVSGFIHEDSQLNYEISFERIPHHVISEAKDWLASQIEMHRDKPITKLFSELLEYLNQEEML